MDMPTDTMGSPVHFAIHLMHFEVGLFETLILSPLPPEDEAQRPGLRALIADAIADLPMHRRAKSW